MAAALTNWSRRTWTVFFGCLVVCALLGLHALNGGDPHRATKGGDTSFAQSGHSKPSVDSNRPPKSGTMPHTAPARQAPDLSVETVLLSEEDGDLLPLMAPVAAQLGGAAGPLPFIVVPQRGDPDLPLLVRRLDPRTCILVRRGEGRLRTVAWATDPRGSRGLARDLTEAALQLRKQYWKADSRPVIADAKDFSAMMHAAVLAAHLRRPLIPLLMNRPEGGAADASGILKAEHILVASGTSARKDGHGATVLTPLEAQEYVLRTIGPSQVRNLIVTRAPNGSDTGAASAWLAPYLSAARKAPVVLCESSDAAEVERRVGELIRKHKLRPRTVTILAGYSSIGTATAANAQLLGEYQVTTEPCAGDIGQGAVGLGVGRIPFADASESSLLIAAGLIRERVRNKPPGKMLLIANPNSAYGALPLAETMARLKAEELRNVALEVDAHYGRLPERPDLAKAAAKADVILYEGHIVDEPLFRPPPAPLPPDLLPPGQDPGPMPVAEGEPPAAIRGPIPMPVEATDFWDEPDPAEPQPQSRPAAPGEATTRPLPGDPDPALPPDPPAAADPMSPLSGMPLVILQSCHSLSEHTLLNITVRGGCGLVGSVTSIHSASGSAFMKALLDQAIYSGATVGEALRDARNYFLCLGLLKSKRGHKQQAKVYRVALSFQLWGDPEMRVFPAPVAKPVRRAVSGTFVGTEAVSVRVPRRKFPDVRTERYAARIHPGSQVAGLVKRLKDKPYRRLTPTYFLRLSAPEGFWQRGHTGLQVKGRTEARTVFLADPFKRFVYILHLPEKDTSDEKIRLRFAG